MLPVKINLPDHTAGDTWEGLSIGPILFDNAQPDVALQSCRLYFRHNQGKAFAYGFTSEAEEGFGVISILDAAAWTIQIPAQALPLTPGLYDWDFETTAADDVIRTLYAGTMRIVLDTSHD